MQRKGFSQNAITCTFILKARGIVQEVDVGNRIHNDIATQGLLEKGVVLDNVLADMYVKCGVLSNAQKKLEEIYM